MCGLWAVCVGQAGVSACVVSLRVQHGGGGEVALRVACVCVLGVVGERVCGGGSV